MIILDFGSGNTCKNDEATIKKMIDKVAELKRRENVVIKWQLFKEQGLNVPLTQESFKFAYDYALKKGIATTASVFDIDSLVYLCSFEVPFIKIANNEESYALIPHCPRGVSLLVSYDFVNKLEGIQKFINSGDRMAVSVKKYPATIEDYENLCANKERLASISDHTVGLDLYKKYRPEIWEKHYKLFDSTGLDAGDFAITAKELKEIL